jgi:hypothetical protein
LLHFKQESHDRDDRKNGNCPLKNRHTLIPAYGNICVKVY